MGGAPIVDERWTAGGGAGTAAAPTAPARARRHRAARPPVAPDEVRLAVSAVWVGTLAEQEARDLGHDRLGTEHLLLALVRLGDAGGRRLTGRGAGLADVRRIVERDGPPGAMDNANGRPGWSTAASAAVRAARVSAGVDGRREVSGLDLLAAILTPGGRAATVLVDLGIDPDAVLAPAATAPDPGRVSQHAAVTDGAARDAVARDAVARDAVAPDAVAPDAVAPDAVAPDAVAPDEVAPTERAPDERAPTERAPDERAPTGVAPDRAIPEQGAAPRAAARVA